MEVRLYDLRWSTNPYTWFIVLPVHLSDTLFPLKYDYKKDRREHKSHSLKQKLTLTCPYERLSLTRYHHWFKEKKNHKLLNYYTIKSTNYSNAKIIFALHLQNSQGNEGRTYKRSGLFILYTLYMAAITANPSLFLSSFVEKKYQMHSKYLHN